MPASVVWASILWLVGGLIVFGGNGASLVLQSQREIAAGHKPHRATVFECCGIPLGLAFAIGGLCTLFGAVSDPLAGGISSLVVAAVLLVGMVNTIHDPPRGLDLETISWF